MIDNQRSLVGVLDTETMELGVISGDFSAPRAAILVRKGIRTLGYTWLDGTYDLVERAIAATEGADAQRAWDCCSGSQLKASVVLCTLGSTALLRIAVESLLTQDHENFELIVVDNDPTSGNVAQQLEAISDPRLRIVAESRRGLSFARNTGVSVSTGDVVAFTDDDAITDRHWLSALLAVFEADDEGRVGAVTGPVFPAELLHPSQRFFEARGGFPKVTSPTVWSLSKSNASVVGFGEPGEGGPLYPFATARVGAGVSMAFRRAVLEEIGPFDTSLGAGTLTNGGEDLDAFARVLHAGFAIITNPDAIVHHVHRRDLSGLEKQSFGNGTGMAALLCKTVVHRPQSIVQLAGRIPAVARRLAPGSQRMVGSDPDVPRSLTKAEITGFVIGPWRYLRAAARQWRSWR
ncbi:glycosyltransferase family 2 protein [Corynebacterium hindlerae]|uniref:glycosyltransferase family 2 protein n=1 Tax=Corynebacterium hindlerae TaxID=699041 RepID=UPI001E2BBD78|nr:glycosyltransferase [Corynebacterium hindlerae]